MNSAKLLQDIFDREIARLDGASRAGGLSAQELRSLDTLISAYSRYRHQNLLPTDDMSEIPTDDLLSQLQETTTPGNEGEDP